MPIFIQKPAQLPNKRVSRSKFHFYIDTSISKANKFNVPFAVFQDNNGFLHVDILTLKLINRVGRKGLLVVSYPRRWEV